jgi:hypothetical protein
LAAVGADGGLGVGLGLPTAEALAVGRASVGGVHGTD